MQVPAVASQNAQFLRLSAHKGYRESMMAVLNPNRKWLKIERGYAFINRILGKISYVVNI